MDAPQPFRVDISRTSVELTIRETAVLPFCGIGSARIGIYWYHAGIRVQTVSVVGEKIHFALRSPHGMRRPRFDYCVVYDEHVIIILITIVRER